MDKGPSDLVGPDRVWAPEWVELWSTLTYGNRQEVEMAIDALEAYDVEYAEKTMKELYDLFEQHGYLQLLGKGTRLHFDMIRVWLNKRAIQKIIKSKKLAEKI